MELGNQVLRYQHESNDLGPDITRDELAFVVGMPSEHVLELVIFPAGGPTKYERVTAYDPENPYNQPGGIYWREVGSAAPDFEAAYKYDQYTEFRTLKAKQLAEYNNAPSAARSGLWDGHLLQQEELRSELDNKYPGDNAPETKPMPPGREHPSDAPLRAGVRRDGNPNPLDPRRGDDPTPGQPDPNDVDRRR